MARYLSRRHPKILMYHRLSSEGTAGTIGVDIFKEQMEILRDRFTPMSLTHLLEANHFGDVPDNAVVVTFDDGYHDFVEFGLPVLKELRIPATLFATTGFVSGELWLWPDQIRYALDNTRQSSLDLPFNSIKMSLRKEKEKIWNTIADYCMTINNEEKKAFIEKLYDDLDVVMPRSAPEKYRALTWEELRAAVKDGIEVGSHSHSHPILTKLEYADLERELIISKDRIHRELGVYPTVFCYPNGQKNDFNEGIKKAVKVAGYEYAVAAFPGRHPLIDLLEIKRYPVGNCIETYEKNVFGFSFIRF